MKKQRIQTSWQHASSIFFVSRCFPVGPEWRDAITHQCCCCCSCSLCDDSVAERLRSQPIVTNRSEMSGGTGKLCKNSNLIIHKGAPPTVSVSNYTERRLISFKNIKKREPGGGGRRRMRREEEKKKKLYCSCQKFILSGFLLYKCVYVNTSHPRRKKTSTHTCAHTHTNTHGCNFSSQGCRQKLSDFHKEKQIYTFIYLFVWVQSN